MNSVVSRLRELPEIRQDVEDGASGLRRAAVAACFWRSQEGKEMVLFIKRVKRKSDPFSGDIALPGGMAELGDASHEATAMRETMEEVGIDLSNWNKLGRLAADCKVDAGPRRRGLLLSIWGFYSEEEPPSLSIQRDEVDVAWWVDLRTLSADHLIWWAIDLRRLSFGRSLPRTIYNSLQGLGLSTVDVVAIRLPNPPHRNDLDHTCLWGLTLSCFSDAFERLEYPPLLIAGRSYRPPALANRYVTALLCLPMTFFSLFCGGDCTLRVVASASSLLLLPLYWLHLYHR